MKRNFLAVGPLLVYVSVTALAYGQNKLPTVDQIVERHLQALGGRDKIDAIHSVVEHLVYREGAHVNPNALLVRMRPYYKTIGDPKDRTAEINEGYDGSAWEYYRDPGVVIRTVDSAAAAARHGTEIIDSLEDSKLLGTRIEMSGAETFAGKPAYKLHLIFADGFEEDLFIDRQSFMIIGNRRSAPIHAFGAPVRSENRIGDYRPVNGVRFPYSITEVAIANGKELDANIVQSIAVNKEFDPSFFSPPQYERTPLQQMLEQLYMERTDPVSVMWTYRGFRSSNSKVDTRDGVEFIGYETVKMSDFRGAIDLLAANAADYPKSASAEFGLGRAYKAAGNGGNARAHFQKALKIDPNFTKANDELDALK